MKTKKIKLAVLLLSAVTALFSIQTANAKILVVNQKMFGEKWPFKRDEIILKCDANGHLFAINSGNLVTYPLTAEASQATEGNGAYGKLEDVLEKDKNNTTQKMSYDVIVEKTRSLCE